MSSIAESPLSQASIDLSQQNRSRGRNIHFYDAKDVTQPLGGLVLTNGVTKANFHDMVAIVITFTGKFELYDEDQRKLERNDEQMLPGNFYIHATGSFEISREPWLVRAVSHTNGIRVEGFRNAVRNRDNRCVISGERVYNGVYVGFDAAHIFPIAHEDQFKECGLDRHITIKGPGGSINSIQNGMLLDRSVHQLFDSYCLSINPDDGFKVVLFTRSKERLAGKHLDEEFQNDPLRPVDPLLRWHFRQAVLANMRDAGEPQFEHDFPPGSDMVGSILSGPKPSARMEFELFTRLAGTYELGSFKE